MEGDMAGGQRLRTEGQRGKDGGADKERRREREVEREVKRRGDDKYKRMDQGLRHEQANYYFSALNDNRWKR